LACFNTIQYDLFIIL